MSTHLAVLLGTTVLGGLVTFVVGNLVENALEHSDRDQPHVELSARLTGDDEFPLRVEVTDDGPGIPDREVSVVESGNERQLEHASGIGLWVTQWAVTDAGGDLTFDDREPRGTVVRIELPYQPVERAAD